MKNRGIKWQTWADIHNIPFLTRSVDHEGHQHTPYRANKGIFGSLWIVLHGTEPNLTEWHNSQSSLGRLLFRREIAAAQGWQSYGITYKS